MKTEHTPGPWHIANIETGRIETEYVGDYIEVHTGEEGYRGDMALIAAAPDLLEGAREAVEWLGVLQQNYPDMASLISGLTKLKATIAKAEGE